MIFFFLYPSRPVRGTTQPPQQWVPCYTRHMPSPSHSSQIYHQHNIGRGVSAYSVHKYLIFVVSFRVCCGASITALCDGVQVGRPRYVVRRTADRKAHVRLIYSDTTAQYLGDPNFLIPLATRLFSYKQPAGHICCMFSRVQRNSTFTYFDTQTAGCLPLHSHTCLLCTTRLRLVYR